MPPLTQCRIALLLMSLLLRRLATCCWRSVDSFCVETRSCGTKRSKSFVLGQCLQNANQTLAAR